jgi:hypothetical protein
LTETIEVFLQTYTKLLREVATPNATPIAEPLEDSSKAGAEVSQPTLVVVSKSSRATTISAADFKKQALLAKKQERYHQIRQLRSQDLPSREIGKRLGIGKSRVERYLKLPEAPKLKAHAHHQWNMSKPFEEYIVGRSSL